MVIVVQQRWIEIPAVLQNGFVHILPCGYAAGSPQTCIEIANTGRCRFATDEIFFLKTGISGLQPINVYNIDSNK